MSSAWELVALRPGGTVAALATALTDEGRPLVFAATAAGLRRSVDAGRSWEVVGAGGALSAPVEVIVPSPAYAGDRTIFVGGAAGLHRSRDQGLNWELVLSEARVLTIALSPDFADESLLFVGTETDGVLRSEDGGRTWAGANPGLLDLTVLALALSPDFARDQTGFAATAAGLYRTRNGGRSWREVGLPRADLAVQCLGVSPGFADDRLVLAGTEADGLFRSGDGGASWEQVEAIGSQAVTAIAFAPRPDAAGLVAVATTEGVYLSPDGGRSWRLAGAADGPALSLAFVDDEAGKGLLAGFPRQGVARCDLANDRWEPANQGLRGSLLTALALSPGFATDGTLFVAGLEDGVAVSTDGGMTWSARCDGLGDSTILGLALSPGYARDGQIYVAAPAGLYRSCDRGASWARLDLGEEGLSVRAVAAGGSREASAVVIALLDGCRLATSVDRGEAWRLLPPIPGEPGVLSLALSPIYQQDRTVFVGAAESTQAGSRLALWRTVDGGVRWQRWFEAPGQGALPLAVPSTYPRDETVFVGLGQEVRRPMRQAQEIRAGQRRPLWQGAVLPGPPVTVTALASSPEFGRDRTLFIATSGGVCVSRDGGATLRDWSQGLEPGPIVVLAPSPAFSRDRLVYALGLGGAVWRRGDRG